MLDRKQARCPNGLKLGTPGSGKSMSCKSEIVSVFLTTADDIFISDPEAEYYPLVKRLHGQVIKLSPTSKDYVDVYKRQEPGHQSRQPPDEVYPAAHSKPQRLDYRAGRKTKRTACTKGGGGSDTSSQSADEVYGLSLIHIFRISQRNSSSDRFL